MPKRATSRARGAEAVADAPAASGGTGPRVLVVEDDAIVAMHLEAELRGAGWEVVGPARWVADALWLADEPLDAALLDVGLGSGGTKSFVVAEALMERGVPVVFLTAYDPEVIPPRMRTRPVLRKPCATRAVLRAVAAAALRRPDGS